LYQKESVMSRNIRRKAQQRSKTKNNPWILWGVVILLALGISAVWLTSRGTTESSGYPREISVDEAVTKRDAGAFILDVRQPEEWNEFHVPDSALIPLGELAARVDELPKDQEIVIVCRSGNRSAQGRDILLDAGFTQVTSMASGLTQWRAAGFPTVSGP
jgi:rhodanese-related sulfurtransferase